MTRIIAMSNHKGGVGKTTSTLNIGAALTKLGQRVLLVDMDPQANLSQSMGFEDTEYSIYGALRGKHELIPYQVIENLDLIPSTLELSAVEIELSAEAGREYIFKELLAPHLDSYDFVFIDCPPSLGLLTINALTAANEVFIPLQAHYLPLRGLTKITEVIDKIRKRLNPTLKIGGVFVTQFDNRKVLMRDVADSIKEYFNENVFKSKIRDNIALAEAPTGGVDIFRYDPKSHGAEDYMELAKEILKNKF